MLHTKATNQVFTSAHTFSKGYLNVSDAPGLGVDYDEKLAKEYPYEPAYLPINRKLDGTMFNW